ncbi:creatininase family protein [Nakamurella lactea]|uniref:creatininase family protein n=1 Tax=Nakamurella lactea TaxID=459515 RepID=UPI0003F840BC|nr:creatininase family protein [Nakamurella lactea]
MTVLHWAETDRQTLSEVLTEALVLLPMGATEQHGRHLPAGTDAIIATAVTEQAAARSAAAQDRQLVIAPTLTIGASDHHLPFGGTLSLSPATLLAVLSDIVDSLATTGCHRLVLVNGHGGNAGICQAAAGAAAARHSMRVAHLDYWNVLAPGSAHPVPGHAGAFETSLMIATRPDLVRPTTGRGSRPPYPAVQDVGLHSAAGWHQIDGYTDEPELATAEIGARWLEEIVAGMSGRIDELARML